MKLSPAVLLLGVTILATIHVMVYVLAEIVSPAAIVIFGFATSKTSQVLIIGVFLAAGGSFIAHHVYALCGNMLLMAIHAILSEAVVWIFGFMLLMLVHGSIRSALFNFIFCELCVGIGVLAGGVLVKRKSALNSIMFD